MDYYHQQFDMFALFPNHQKIFYKVADAVRINYLLFVLQIEPFRIARTKITVVIIVYRIFPNRLYTKFKIFYFHNETIVLIFPHKQKQTLRGVQDLFLSPHCTSK